MTCKDTANRLGPLRSAPVRRRVSLTSGARSARFTVFRSACWSAAGATANIVH